MDSPALVLPKPACFTEPVLGPEMEVQAFMIRRDTAAAAVFIMQGRLDCMREMMHTPALESITALWMGHCNYVAFGIEVFPSRCLNGFQRNLLNTCFILITRIKAQSI